MKNKLCTILELNYHTDKFTKYILFIIQMSSKYFLLDAPISPS